MGRGHGCALAGRGFRAPLPGHALGEAPCTDPSHPHPTPPETHTIAPPRSTTHPHPHIHTPTPAQVLGPAKVALENKTLDVRQRESYLKAWGVKKVGAPGNRRACLLPPGP